jgi:protein-S-isoprenylcysteine O-methyltransferase Ste14
MPTFISRLFSRQRILVSRVAAACFFVALLSMRSLQADTLSAAFLYVMGLTLIGVATAGRLWCALYISGYKGSSLVTSGPYSLCRNPLYFFSLLGFAGVGFTTETWTLGLVALASFSLMYPSVIAGEEKHLHGQFGAAFDDYCARVPRFIPRFGDFREPGAYTVNPRVFRRALKDIIWFVWAAGLIELVESLHELGYIKPLFGLY